MYRVITLALSCFVYTTAAASEAMIGVASMYQPGSFRWGGPKASNGTLINFNTGATVAHPKAALSGPVPFGTCFMVRYPAKSKRAREIEVSVNDNGPHMKGRVLDVPPGVARYLHFPGLGKVAYWEVACSGPPLPRAKPDFISASLSHSE